MGIVVDWVLATHVGAATVGVGCIGIQRGWFDPSARRPSRERPITFYLVPIGILAFFVPLKGVQLLLEGHAVNIDLLNEIVYRRNDDLSLWAMVFGLVEIPLGIRILLDGFRFSSGGARAAADRTRRVLRTFVVFASLQIAGYLIAVGVVAAPDDRGTFFFEGPLSVEIVQKLEGTLVVVFIAIGALAAAGAWVFMSELREAHRHGQATPLGRLAAFVAAFVAWLGLFLAVFATVQPFLQPAAQQGARVGPAFFILFFLVFWPMLLIPLRAALLLEGCSGGGTDITNDDAPR
jgi:hypothetical protein